MMVQKFTEQDVRLAIKRGFESLVSLFRVELRKNWKRTAVDKRYAAGRSMVQLRNIAKNPDEHFSRSKTWQAWQGRADAWVKENNVAPEDAQFAFYIVHGPAEVALGKMDGFFGAVKNGDLHSEFYNLCNSVQRWEYGRTSKDATIQCAANVDAEKIIAQSQRLVALAQVESAKPVMKQVKQFMYDIKYQR